MLAVVAVTLGYASVSRGAGYALRVGDTARAHALAPGDGRVTGAYAQAQARAGMEAGADVTAADRARADRLARDALRQDPTAVAAISTLGLDTQIRGDTVGARRLFAYAERLSRRDLQTQVWGIEDAVSRGDIAAALNHYDIALRTSRDASGLLFPILASAIAERPVRAALIGTLARQPAWAPHLIGYVANEGSELRAAATLFAELRRARMPVSDAASVALIDRMVGSNLFGEAWSYYTSVRPGADRRRSRDPGFARDPRAASLFDWRPVESSGMTVSIGGERAGTVDFAAVAGTGGTAVQQLQALPAGPYRLAGRATGIDQAEGSLPYWSLTCRDGRELGRAALSSRGSNGLVTGRFVVPTDCPVQTLALVVRSSEAMTGVAGQIGRTQLAPAR